MALTLHDTGDRVATVGAPDMAGGEAAILRGKEHGNGGYFLRPAPTRQRHAGLDEPDRVFEWLEESYGARDTWLPFMHVEPAFDRVRSDPRFQDLLRRMNFPD